MTEQEHSGPSAPEETEITYHCPWGVHIKMQIPQSITLLNQNP